MFQLKNLLFIFLIANIVLTVANASESTITEPEDTVTIVSDAETADSINERDSALNVTESDSVVEKEEAHSDSTDSTLIEDEKPSMTVDNKESEENEHSTSEPKVDETTSGDNSGDMKDANSGIAEVTPQTVMIQLGTDETTSVPESSSDASDDKAEEKETSVENTSEAMIPETTHNETLIPKMSVNEDISNKNPESTESTVVDSKEDESAANSADKASNEMPIKTEENKNDSPIKEINAIDVLKTPTSSAKGKSLESTVPENEKGDQSFICDFKDEVVCDGFELVCWGGGSIDCDEGITYTNTGTEKKGRKFAPQNEILCKTSPQLKCARTPLIKYCRGKSVCRQTILENPSDRPLRYWEVAIIAAITAAAGVTVITIITVVFISLTRLKIGPETDFNRRTLPV